MKIIEQKNNIIIAKNTYKFGELTIDFINYSKDYFKSLLCKISLTDATEIQKKISAIFKLSHNPVVNELSNLKEKTIEEELNKKVDFCSPLDYLILLSYIQSLKIGDNYISFTNFFLNDIQIVQREFYKALKEIFDINSKHNINLLIEKYNSRHDFKDNIFKNFECISTIAYKYNKTNLSVEKHIDVYDYTSFLIYDFINCINYKLNGNSIFVKNCRNKNCKKFFLTNRSTIVYCDIHKHDIANKNYAYSKRIKNDEHYHIYSKAYSRIYKQYSKSLDSKANIIFSNWQKQAKRKLNLYKSNNISDKDFFDFFEKTNSPFHPSNRKKYL